MKAMTGIRAIDRSFLARYGAAVLLSFASTLVRAIFNPLLGQDVPFIFHFPAIVVSSWLGGLGPGIVTTLLSALQAGYLFVVPAPSPTDFRFLVPLAIFIGAGVLISIVAERGRESQKEADEERERLRVTLASIGDAVIVTDASGQVTFQNDVAAALTGRALGEAKGRPIEEVFRIVSEKTGEPVENPVPRILREGRVVGLANHTVLIARDGTSRPIDDSGAPIRNEKGQLTGVVLVFRDATGKRAAEEEIRRARERFQGIFDSSTDGIVFADRDGTILEMNEAFCTITGYNRPELAGRRKYQELTPEEYQASEAAIVQRIFETGAPARYEKEYLRKDGSRVPLEITRFLVRNEEGAPAGIAGILRDTSERKRAQQEVRTSEERFRILADSAPVLVWMAGTDKLCHFFNRPWLEFTGRTMEQELGNGWAEGVHAEDFDRCLSVYTTSIDKRREFEMEYRLRRFDGEYRWVLDHGVPLHGAGGEFTGYIGSCVDITERKRTENEIRALLRISERLNATLEIDELLDLLVQEAIELVESEGGVAGILRPEGMVAKKYFQKGEVIPLDYCWPPGFGLPGWLILHRVPYVTNDAKSDPQIVQELCRTFGVWSAVSVPVIDARGDILGFFEIHNRKDGSGFTPTDQENLQAVAQIASVAIQNAIAYRGIREARAQAEEASRSKDEFLATVSHELRTPLSAIVGWTKLLRSGELDEEKTTEALEIVERNAKAQAQLVEDLLDVSRIVSGKIRLDVRPVSLDAVVESALRTLRPTAEAKGVRILSVLDPKAGPVSGDGSRLQQVVWNLVSNAIKFTPRGGRVQVTLTRINSHVEITVSDTGRGIRAEFLPYVFDRFRQGQAGTTREYGGLGLGLAIVRHLVELHGGSASAESAGEGKGATFTVRLPVMVVRARLDEEEHVHPTVEGRIAAALDRPPDLSGVRVLVIDDEPDTRKLLREVLEAYGGEVRDAGSAAQGLRDALEWNPSVIVCDIGMPVEDGYTFIQKLRAAEKERGTWTPAVALTAYARTEDRVRALSLGFQIHVAKPIEPVELALVVTGLIGGTREAG